MPSPGLLLGASMFLTDINPDPNILNRHGIQPNICNRSRSWSNNTFTPLQLSSPFPQSIPTHLGPDQIPATYVGDPLISVRSRSPLYQYSKATPDFYNRRHGHPNYIQPTPQLPEILPTDARDFKPRVAASTGPSEIFTPGLPLTRSSEALAI